MPGPQRRREVGRGERVLPGVWRLRLPLPWPGVPHCNAWALASGDGIVLVDTGVHEPGSLAQLERAMDQVGLRLEHVRLVVCTHAHADHCGQAGPVMERARDGCELWMHPNRGHYLHNFDDPDGLLTRRIEIALQSGVPEAPLREWADARRGQSLPGLELPPVARELVPGVEIGTDLGVWQVVETPGHAPSHVCLYQPERRLLLSGDHLLGRVSLYYDFGYTPDPVGEFLSSLDRVDELDVRLALSGHGRPFTDIHGHVEANRALVRQRLHGVRTALGEGERTAFELAQRVYQGIFTQQSANWLFTKLLCYLTHLERLEEIERLPGEPERWRLLEADERPGTADGAD